MDLHLATSHDIAEELLRRRHPFFLATFEDTNSRRGDSGTLAGRGMSLEAVLDLLERACDDSGDAKDEESLDAGDGLV